MDLDSVRRDTIRMLLRGAALGVLVDPFTETISQATYDVELYSAEKCEFGVGDWIKPREDLAMRATDMQARAGKELGKDNGPIQTVDGVTIVALSYCDDDLEGVDAPRVRIFGKVFKGPVLLYKTVVASDAPEVSSIASLEVEEVRPHAIFFRNQPT